MSDVEKQIKQWRAGLADSEAIGPPDLEEMESHLREEITHLQAADLSATEAFLIVRHRLGDPTALEEEFVKVSPYRHVASHLSWMAVGVMVYLSVSKLSECATYTSAWIARAFALPQAWASSVWAMLMPILAAGLIAWLVVRDRRRLETR
ncbi:MAG: permease prefix domain 1-containing protein [Solirubrobacterales bacterium]